jgi:hypothetical protein
MNMVRHNNIPTYRDIEGVLGALGEKNECLMNFVAG